MSLYDIENIYRFLSNVVKIGKIEERNDSNQYRVRFTKDLLSNWISATVERACNDRDSWPLEIGEQVIVLSPGGNLSQGVIIGILNQKKYPPVSNNPDVSKTEYGDGTTVEYNRKSHELKITLTDEGKAELIAKGGIHFVGDLTHEGNLKRKGNETVEGKLNRTGNETITGMITSTLDQVAGGVSQINHPHPFTHESGKAGKTDKPIPGLKKCEE